MSGKPTRRSVLQALVATGALHTVHASAQPLPEPTGWLLLGNGQEQGIFRARWDGQTGQIGKPELAVATQKPSFLTTHPKLPVLYCCNEEDGPDAAVSAFTLDRHTATLRPISSELTHGGDPCFVSVDPSGRLLFAANYGGGSLAVFPLSDQGKPAPAKVFACAGNPVCGAPGPVKDRQGGPHLHCAVLSPDGRSVLACNLGDDSILIFPIHPGNAQQPLGTPVRVAAAAGAGPRHLAFHPNGRWLYCINELDCTVVVYRWAGGDQPRAELVPGSSATIRPAHAGDGVTSTGAEIALTRDGRFAYTSTRFSDVLTVFRLDAATGKLTQVQQLPCGGKTPRFFSLDPSERWLLSGNQDSDSISVFQRDATSGQLSPKSTFPAPNPQCLLWL